MTELGAALEPAKEPTNGRTWKLVGAGVAAAYGTYRLFTEVTGDAILGFVIAACLFVGELNFPSFGLTRLIRDRAVLPLRKFFGYGDSLARVLMIIIAFGGTVLIIKVFFGLRLIPDEIDFIIKRGGIALAGVTVALYCDMIISKLSFELSHVRYDTSTIGHEFAFYVAILCFCTTFVLGIGGNGIIDKVVTNGPDRVPPFTWDVFTLMILFCLCLISIIWSICFGLNIVSRIFEYYWRDRLEQGRTP